MAFKLFYLNIVEGKKELKFDREFEEGELNLINECNEILGDFNSFCDYFSMLDNSLKELKKYIEKIEKFDYKISNPIKSKEVIVEINRKIINFVGMFKTFLDYYEVQVKEVFGNDSDEIKEFKKKSSKFFDNYFEYRFLYNLRHFCVHYKLPATKLTQNVCDGKRKVYISKDKLQMWNGWKANIKQDIQNLNKDIDISEFILKVEKILKEFNKEISYYNTSEVLGVLKILKKYLRANQTPYIVEEIESNGKKSFNINTMISDYVLATNNILKLGIISCAVYNKEYGLQIFDPYDLMFSKEEKEKFKLE